MIIDDLEKINQLDKSNLLGSIVQLPDQCRQTWEDVFKIIIPESYRNVKNIVVSGMGGSALGPHIVKSVFNNELKVPLEIVNGYQLPGYVDESSLLLLSSYSGGTEEVLATAKEGLARKAKCLGITKGSELEKLFVSENLPYFKINDKFNPCQQPRMGLGYSILGILGLLANLGFIQVKNDEIEKLINFLQQNNKNFGVAVKTGDNQAKIMSLKLVDKVSLLIAAEFLAGSVHAWQNQQHEIAKNFGSYWLLPEMNHHLLEGLAFPKTNSRSLIGIFIKSSLFNPRTQNRFSITRKIFAKNGIETLEYICHGENKLMQAFEVLQFGSWTNFYLAMLNGLDPTPIPYVDYFKKEISSADPG